MHVVLYSLVFCQSDTVSSLHIGRTLGALQSGWGHCICHYQALLSYMVRWLGEVLKNSLKSGLRFDLIVNVLVWHRDKMHQSSSAGLRACFCLKETDQTLPSDCGHWVVVLCNFMTGRRDHTSSWWPQPSVVFVLAQSWLSQSAALWLPPSWGGKNSKMSRRRR